MQFGCTSRVVVCEGEHGVRGEEGGWGEGHRAEGAAGKGSGRPARAPWEWNSTGRHRLSSCRRELFWKCATIAFLPWMRAYVMLHTCTRHHLHLKCQREVHISGHGAKWENSQTQL